MDGDDDDFVVSHASNDFDDMFGILGREAGGWLVEQINVGHADHIEADVETFAFTAAERLFYSAAYDCVAPFAKAEFD